MSATCKIEIFSAGCPACEPAVAQVSSLTCECCSVEVLDMKDPAVAARARKYGVQCVPSIVVNGKLTGCCAGGASGET